MAEAESQREIRHNAYFQALEATPGLYDLETPAFIEPVLPERGEPALPLAHRTLSYREMLDSVTRLAGELCALGVEPGDRVLLMVPMSIALYQSMLATFKCGAVCLFIDPADGVVQLDRTAARLAPRAFIGTAQAQALRRVCPSVARVPLAVSTGAAAGGARALAALIAEGPADFATVPRALHDPAIITFTSGSSGVPKGVRRTHHDLRAQFRMLSLHEGKRMKGVNLCAFPVLPIDDVSAGRSCLLAATRPGRAAEADPRVLLDQVRQFPPTLISVAPAMFERIVDTARATGTRLDSVRHVYTGGGPVPLAALAVAREALPQAEINMVYGSTEAEPVSMITAREVLESTAELTARGEGACVGHPAPDVQVAVVEVHDGPLDALHPAAEGELAVSGPHVNRSYFENDEETRRNKIFDAATGMHWHRMGDLGYRDADGRLWITGRLAHRVVTRERTFDTGRVEPRFVAIPGVRRAALVGVPVARAGAASTAAAVLLQLATGADRLAVMRAARELASTLGLPWVQEVPAIPLDRRIGAKVQYADLAARFGPLIRQALSDPFGGRVAEYLAERFPPRVSFVAALVLTAGIASVAVNPWWGSPLRLAAVSAVVFLFLYHLRVYDEQKDGERDRVTHPQRVLSRGIVTVGELTTLDRHGMVVQGVLALLLGLSAAGWWLAAAVYAWLMRREFFVGDWLRARIVLYGISHSLIVLWIAQFIVAGVGGQPPELALGVLAASLAWFQEVARKLDPADAGPRVDTRDSDESYLRDLGIGATGALLAGMQLVVVGLALQLAWQGGAGTGFTTAVGGAGAIAFLATLGFVTGPSRKAGKKVQGASLLLGLVTYVALASRPWWRG